MNTLMVKKLALMLISRKLNENPKDKQNSDFDKKEMVKAVPAWLAIAGLIYTMISSPEFLALLG